MNLRALVYVRPRTRKFFEYISSSLFCEYKTICEWKFCKSHYKYAYYFKYNMKNLRVLAKTNRKAEDVFRKNFKIKELEDIIKRCRLLRALPFYKSVLLIKSAFHTFYNILIDNKFDVLLGPVIDSYVLDVLERTAKIFNIKYVGLHVHYFPNHFRVTARGEYNDSFREVPNEEIDFIIQNELREDKTVNFKLYESSLLKDFFYRYLKDKLKFWYFKLLEQITNYKYNYHYNTAGLGVWCKGLDFIFYKKYNDFHSPKDIIFPAEKIKIFIPLHYYPEATVDYWTKNLDLIEMEKVLYTIIENLRDLEKDILVYVKEHPNMVGYRDPYFYKMLKNFPYVRIVDPSISSNFILKWVDYVLTWNGSIGIESIYKNKKVITIGEPYYNYKNYFITLKNRVDIENISEIIISANKQNEKYDLYSFTKHILRSTLVGTLNYVDFNENDENKIEQARTVVESLRKYFKNLFDGV